jgi:3-deoxy-7-phosphoheptulonate synthase
MVIAESSFLLPALQQPDWSDNDRLRRVCDRLADAPAPVDVSSVQALGAELARVASGEGFVVVGGDCAELFSEATPARIIEKADHLHRISDVISRSTGVHTTRIGRFGGQFAKPRSQPFERLNDGQLIPSYRGDAVHGIAADQRQPDPTRLLLAHRYTTDAVRALHDWDLRRRRGIVIGSRPPAPRTFLSHEALLLDYERSLLRDGGRHASSGHYLWIGDRTRDPAHGHIAFAESVGNPVGVKLGPSADPFQVRTLVDILDPEHEHCPGRLSFIVRMGAALCEVLLPPVIDALGPRARDVLWILDPMHGNGRTNVHGQKTRLLTELHQEIRAFFAVLSSRGVWPAGIHLEMTPDDVTECVYGPADMTRWLPDYRSACDPRLNPTQTASVAGLVATLLSTAG